jgi:hypothetical protein
MVFARRFQARAELVLKIHVHVAQHLVREFAAVGKG